MRIAYLDCFSGISGNMCLGALLDAGVPLESMEAVLARLPVRGYRLKAERVLRRGLAATHVEIELDPTERHPHRGLGDVLDIIERAGLEAPVAERSVAVFRNLAEAEAMVHGTDVESVHFHEVGAVDAICDIVGTVAGLAQLGVERLLFSTVRVGGGTVKVAHGTLPVPAPATAELLKGLPTAGGPVQVELATPTGAAILKTLGEPCPEWPAMSVLSIGYGAGGRDPQEVPNVLRLALGEAPPAGGAGSDCVWVLETNLDDMTGEQVGYCMEKLAQAGALDAFTAPVQMKKGRPGVQVTVLCEPERLRAAEEVLWRHTTTLGVRRCLWQRSKLSRQVRTAQTPYGPVRVKVASLGREVLRCKPEYEDCRALAEASGVPLEQVCREALRSINHDDSTSTT
jgi:uncharacterized protein (TIGR00299 family) protein